MKRTIQSEKIVTIVLSALIMQGACGLERLNKSNSLDKSIVSAMDKTLIQKQFFHRTYPQLPQDNQLSLCFTKLPVLLYDENNRLRNSRRSQYDWYSRLRIDFQWSQFGSVFQNSIVHKFPLNLPLTLDWQKTLNSRKISEILNDSNIQLNQNFLCFP